MTAADDPRSVDVEIINVLPWFGKGTFRVESHSHKTVVITRKTYVIGEIRTLMDTFMVLFKSGS